MFLEESCFEEATSKTWTQTLDPDPEKPGLWKTQETAGCKKKKKKKKIRKKNGITY